VITSDKIGIIAGNGQFPSLALKEARKKGHTTITIAIKGETDTCAGELSDKIYWLELGEIKKTIDILKEEEINNLIMVGGIDKKKIIAEYFHKDSITNKIAKNIIDRRDTTIANAVIGVLTKNGINVLDSSIFLKDYLVKHKIYTKRCPTPNEKEDIRFGWKMAKKASGMDIGQSIAVKNRTVLAIEAVEGTNALIKRAGMLATGSVLVKTARPQQDMRFDIPVIGFETIKKLVESKINIIAVEAEKMLFYDEKAAVKLADDSDISIVGVKQEFFRLNIP